MKQAVVYREHTVGLLSEGNPSTLTILASIPSFGASELEVGALVEVKPSDCRPATQEDFDLVKVDLPNESLISQRMDQDGFYIVDTAKELERAERGCLEVTIQRPNSKITRYFRCSGIALCNMYRQAISNNKVVLYSIA